MAKASRILGIDFGLSRLGLALSDERKMLASPLMTFQAERRSELTAAKLVDQMGKWQEEGKYQIEEIIIGLPLMMSGKTGLLADEVKHFVQVLSQITPIPIKTWDERLSTVQAERAMREGNLTRKRRAKSVDTVAAVIILQSYLDFKGLSAIS